MYTIQLCGVSFHFPGSDAILTELTFSLRTGIVALAGPNGAGKTTLLHLMMRNLTPERGQVIWQGFSEFGWLPQNLRSVGAESSGEDKMRRLAALMRNRDGILFLDEPETHLDTKNRNWLRVALKRHRGLVVIVSHDPALLGDAGLILHTENKAVAPYRMPYAEYLAEIANEKLRREVALDRAERETKKTERTRQKDLERQLRRSQNAAKRAPLAGIPRIAQGIMKRNAEVTLGKIIRRSRIETTLHNDEIGRLRAEKGRKISYDFALAANQPARRSYLEIKELQLEKPGGEQLWQRPVSFSAKTGDRIQITAPNGAGKSMLLKTVLGSGELSARGNVTRPRGEIQLIDSMHTNIAPNATPLELVLNAAIAEDEGMARRLLGGYGFRGEAALRAFTSLSAGEKMRLRLLLISQAQAPLAAVFSDEAETGLDRETRGLYAEFLNTFTGIVLVVSHDASFIAALAITDRVVLDMSPGIG